ncbi:MAG TPA: cation acetate symporter [Desulfotomaculum sp.]|nr:MAG: sodium transporter [Peptococcaceae bacterium BRH_c8a]KJS76657.1 MAG: sodium transporter [Desulfotomaculum sp. BICA1-6]HBX22740.1 cation acetate symporter [Desulfotomaculum sp.]
MFLLEPKYIFTIILLATIVGITFATQRYTKSTVNFYVGGRSFGWALNGSAIAGDYLSAATFLGLAGLTFAFGYDGIFYTFCFSAGLTLLTVFVAGPLRKFGAYTVPDFLAQRFHSQSARLVAVIVVLAISGFYAAPQILGAAAILKMFFGATYQFGVLFTVIVMVFYVGVGGMKGTTINQALEIWIRFGAFIILFAIAVSAGYNYGKIMELLVSFQGAIPDTAAIAGTAIMHDGTTWEWTGGYLFKTLPSTISILFGLVFGTLGLPHILLRFYTNPSAREARLSGLFAIGIASVFFFLALYLGTVGRAVFVAGGLPEHVAAYFTTGGTNMVIPALAEALGGRWLLGIVVAGAFAAVFSNLSGLFIASTGALGHDIYTHFINTNADEKQKVKAARWSTVICGVFYGILGLMVETAAIGHLVGLAFNVAASTFAPIFILGIWWRGMTEKGAIAGMLVGLISSLYFIFLPQFVPEAMRFPVPGLWTVPLGFLAVYVVSKIDGKVPADVNEFMAKIHSKGE